MKTLIKKEDMARAKKIIAVAELEEVVSAGFESVENIADVLQTALSKKLFVTMLEKNGIVMAEDKFGTIHLLQTKDDLDEMISSLYANINKDDSDVEYKSYSALLKLFILDEATETK